MKRLLLAIFISVGLLASCRGNKNSAVRNDAGRSVSEMRERGMAALNRNDMAEAVAVGKKLLNPAEYDQSARGNEAAIYGRIILGQGIMNSDTAGNAYQYMLEAEKLCREAKNDSALASVYNGMGVYYMNKENDYVQSLKYLFAGIEAAKRSKNERLHSLLLVNVGVNYLIYDDPNGLRYSMECYNRGKKLGDGRLQYMGAITSAKQLVRNKDFQQAQKYLEEAETLMHANQMHDETDIYSTYGQLYWHLGDYERSKSYFQEALKLGGKERSQYATYLYLSNIYQKENRLEQAERLLRQAYGMMGDNIAQVGRKDVVENLVALLEKRGKTAEAAQLRHKIAADEVERKLKDSSRLIESLRSRYDAERAEYLLTARTAEMERERQMVWILAAVVLIVLGGGIGIFLLYRRKSRLYAAIVRQASDWARQEGVLRTTIKELETRITDLSTQQTGGGVTDHIIESSASGITDTTQDNVVETGEATATPSSQNSDMDDDISDNQDEDVDFDVDNPDVSDKDVDQILHELRGRFEALMSDPAVYCDPEISKEKVSRLLGTNRTYVSRMVNRLYGVNFPAYVNALRIREAIRVLSDPANTVPLKTLAQEIGYSSIATFYVKFKEETGMTPASFRKKVKQI